MKEGPIRTDIRETNGTETAEEKIFRSCTCGWTKETTLRGLRQHQRIRECPQADRMQPCTAQADETRREQCQIEHHSATEPTVINVQNPPEPPDTNPLVNFQAAERAPVTNNTRKEKDPNRKKNIKWPKAEESEAWTSTWHSH